MNRAAALLSLAAFAWGCDQDQPVESANMRRPSGLLAVDRGLSGTATRSDVLIVDAESQGVRVLQYLNDDGALGKRFLPGPVVFFPLIISAPGYPTRVAMNAPRGPDQPADTAFVIATADVGLDLDTVREGRSYIHVLDVPPLSVTDRITPDDHILVNSLDITEPVPGAVFVPVDIISLGVVGDADRVAVAFDELGSGSGRIVIYDFPATVPEGSADLAIEPTAVHEVPGGVNEITLHNGRLYGTSIFDAATSSVANFVTEVDPIAGVTQMLDAGGPTRGLLSAPPFGLLALRADIPSVVVFEGDPPVRSNRDYASPYTRVEERGLGGDELGRIDLRDSPLGPAAYAPYAALTAEVMSTTTSTNRLVLVTHANGFGSLLYADPDGDPNETFGLGVISEPEVTAIFSLGAPGSIANCEADTTETVGDANPDCSVQVVQVPTPGAARYRARFRGAMVRSRAGSVTAAGTEWTLRDSTSGLDYVERQVRVGDGVRIAAPDVTVCTGERGQARYDGTVEAVTADALTVQITTPIEGMVCPEVDPFFYEVFPGGDEAVLVRVNAGAIVEVLERVPTAPTSNGLVEAVFGASAGPDGLLPPLGFTLDTGDSCDPIRTDGDFCSSFLECAPGWGCVAPILNTDDDEAMEEEEPPEDEEEVRVPTLVAGVGRCELSVCPQGAVCLESAFNRGCPGVEFTILGTLSAELDLKQDSSQPAASVPSAAPDDAVSIDYGRQFLVSYPGARSVVEVRPGATILLDQIR